MLKFKQTCRIVCGRLEVNKPAVYVSRGEMQREHDCEWEPAVTQSTTKAIFWVNQTESIHDKRYLKSSNKRIIINNKRERSPVDSFTSRLQ